MTISHLRVSDSTAEPVSLSEMKTQVRASTDITAEDTLIQDFEQAAREWVEHNTRRIMVNQDWRMRRDNFPSDNRPLFLRRVPVNGASNVTVQHVTSSGSTLTFNSTSFYVDTDREPGRVVLKDGETWPSTDIRDAAAVKVEWTAGYGGGSSAVPESLRSSVRLLTAHWYNRREAVTSDSRPREVPLALKSLVNQWTVPTAVPTTERVEDRGVIVGTRTDTNIKT